VKLFESSEKLGIARSAEDPRKFAKFTQTLFGEVLKRAINPMVDVGGRQLFARVEHTRINDDGTAETLKSSRSLEEAEESYNEYFAGEGLDGRHVISVDMPVPRNHNLTTAAMRLCVRFHAPHRDKHDYQLTAYNPGDETAEFTPPERFCFRKDAVKNRFLITNYGEGGTEDYRIRTMLRGGHDLDHSRTFVDDRDRLNTAYEACTLPEFTWQDVQRMDLGSCAFASYQLSENLRVMSAVVGDDIAQTLVDTY
jgi:hypothetical protein